MHPIVTRNYYRILRSGGLNEYVPVEPMSPFKWRQLVELARKDGLVPLLSNAIRHSQYEEQFNMPRSMWEPIHQEASEVKFPVIKPSFTSKILSQKLKELVMLEMHSAYCSEESIRVLSLLVANCEELLIRGLNMHMLLKLANFTKVHERNIDFDKVNKWLTELRILDVAKKIGWPEPLSDWKIEDPKLLKKHFKLLKSKPGLTHFMLAPQECTAILINRLVHKLDKLEE